MTDDELTIIRRAYARHVLAVAGALGNNRLEAAFREVRREHFLGLEPWSIAPFERPPVGLPDNDPVYAYQDVLFVLSRDRGVNNGQPSLHARMLNALEPQHGQSVVHLGAGTGYYTAILGHLVGPQGRVTAVEVDPKLGERARSALQGMPWVDVVIGDAEEWPEAETDRVYVSFGVTAPAAAWVERLAPGGRLAFPLGVPTPGPGSVQFHDLGAAIVVERRPHGFAAASHGSAYFIHAEGGLGAVDNERLDRLKRAFQSGTVDFVRSLVWHRSADPGRCWYWSPEWSLSFDPP